MFTLFNVFCVLFTLYYLARVAIDTHQDIHGTPITSKLVYAKRFTRKFIENFAYHLP